MNKRSFMIPTVSALSVALTGCGDSIVGDWNGELVHFLTDGASGPKIIRPETAVDGTQTIISPGFPTYLKNLDVDFVKMLAGGGPGPGPIRAVGRDEGGDHDHAGARHQGAQLADATNVLSPIFRREAEIGRKTVADVVAVQDVDLIAEREEAAPPKPDWCEMTAATRRS